MSHPALPRDRLESLLRHRTSRDPLLRSLRERAADDRVPLWIVGGYVRDAALGLRTFDLDLVAGRGSARLVRGLQSAWATSGFRFRKRGVTTWRFAVAERRVDLVDAARRGLARDLARRELTINAVAFDLVHRHIEDPLHGLRDLRDGRLRPPRPGALLDDPVRALRACRFLAQLPRFGLTRAARGEAAAAARRLQRAPAERVRPELDRLLLGRDPARGLDWLGRLGLRRALLPLLEPLQGCVAGAGRPDVWTHTLDALRAAAGPRRLPGAARVCGEEDRLVLRWALLLHDVAKPRTLARRDDGRPTFHGHEVAGARVADALLRRLKTPRERRRRIGWLVRNHLRPGHLADAGAPPRGLRRLAREAGDELPLLVLHAACDARASGAAEAAARWRRLRSVLDELLALSDSSTRTLPRLVDGRDVMRVLGLEPGPRIGRVLERIRELQEAGEVRTRHQALARLRRGPRHG